MEVQNEDEFIVDTDIRRNIIVTFINDTMFDAGDQILIMTGDLVAEVIREYKRNNKPITKVTTK